MITVLMSSFNGENYIRDQIDSIMNQKDVELSLLVRDDGSIDNTIEILKEYKERYSNFDWYTGTNLGCGKSFYQLVLDAPISEYYAFADQDDVWDLDKLSVAISKLSGVHKAALYCSSVRPVDENLNVLHQKTDYQFQSTFGIALTQAIAPGCSYVFNNPLLQEFKKLGIDNIDIHDWALFRVVTAVDGYVYYDTEAHFSYRQHGNNVIGYKSSIIDHWKGRLKRFKNRDYRRIRYDMAVKIKDVYYNEMTDTNRLILDTFINYNLSFRNKIKLLTSKDIRMLKGSDNIVFKILVLFDMV